MKKIGHTYETGTTIDIWDFEKTITKHSSFLNMGRVLRLTGADRAFMYKGTLYRAHYFPNFGSSRITYWKDPKDNTSKVSE